jgi:hypothetical protein
MQLPTHFGKLKIAFFNIALLTLVQSGCVREPDLVPIIRASGTGPAAYCEKDSLGRLVVTVRNEGVSTALESTKTKVEFVHKGVFVKSVPAIPVGGNAEVAFDIPADCFDPDCNFIITVDADNRLDELIEENNTVDGICASRGKE